MWSIPKDDRGDDGPINESDLPIEVRDISFSRRVMEKETMGPVILSARTNLDNSTIEMRIRRRIKIHGVEIDVRGIAEVIREGWRFDYLIDSAFSDADLEEAPNRDEKGKGKGEKRNYKGQE